MNKRIRKPLVVFIFILLFLSLILSIIPGLLFEQKFRHSETLGLIIDNLIIKYRYIYILFFIAISIIFILFKYYFPNDYKTAKKFADKKLYDESDLKSDIPPIVWMSLIGIILLMIIIGFVLVK